MTDRNGIKKNNSMVTATNELTQNVLTACGFVNCFPLVLLASFFFIFCGAATQRGSWPHSWGFLDHTQRRITVGRTPLDEWSARRRDLYLTTHNSHNRQISMLPMGFEPTISASERPQTYALDSAATGTGPRQILQWPNQDEWDRWGM